MGPFSLDVAIGSKPVDKVKALILLSHGIGGSELGHSFLAQALARNGYLVAALRHPGDNWQDRSLIEKSPERYFDERPRQASRVIDAILADPAWKDRIATDSRGPRVGALGHSAGGYTVLALAGAQSDLSPGKKALPSRRVGRSDLLRHRPVGRSDGAVTGCRVFAQGRARSRCRGDGAGGCAAYCRIARRCAAGDHDLRGRTRSIPGAAVSR
jgi:pimeloyl-ACP methyl ester carboxylesterase